MLAGFWKTLAARHRVRVLARLLGIAFPQLRQLLLISRDGRGEQDIPRLDPAAGDRHDLFNQKIQLACSGDGEGLALREEYLRLCAEGIFQPAPPKGNRPHLSRGQAPDRSRR